MPDIFLSYSREDQLTARRFAEAFGREGFSVWWDQALRSGEAYDRVTEESLRTAKAVVVLWSNTSVDSRWVRAEATSADRRNTLVPVMIAPCERPIMFELTHTAELSHWKGDVSDVAWRALIDDLRLFIDRSATTSVEPALPMAPPTALSRLPRAIRRAVIPTLALLVLATGVWVALRFVGQSDRKAPVAVQVAEKFSPPANSLAVMPFANMSGDPAQEYFSDGLTEELLDSLVRVNGLLVSARTSAFSFKGSTADIPTIARKLNVNAVLEGSVRRSGTRVRITAQLVDAMTGYQLWSETYDNEIKDILTVQSRVAAAVTEALKVKLLPEDESRLAAGGTSNPAAYDAYLRGMAASKVQKDVSSDRAVLAAFEEALRLDTDFALAHAAYARATVIFTNSWSGSLGEIRGMIARAKVHADRAVQLAPTLAAGYVAQSLVTWFQVPDRSWVPALRHALALEPNNQIALRTFARMAAGIPPLQAEALAAAQQASRIDPLSADSWTAQGVVLYLMRRHTEATAPFARALAMRQDSWIDRTWYASNELVLGHVDEVIALLQSATSWNERSLLAIALQKAGRSTESRDVLRALQKEFGEALAFQYVQIHAQWGEPQQALEWLRKAVALNDVADIESDPMLDPIRNTPEFQAVLRQLERKQP